ncbi:nucleoside diphosphate kinase 7, putative [Eimeria tenella]|uniref:Nucleoside diphosphate kinase 7, putative n=1 Tax=Eimeria tenella TaxID=5802 RepID=U6KNR5_EIMTE|nr:nucleoside diphosphate kinase 7, putative [Eimeria tenella]CDJ37902.1 nucleoside diphosphate kinase 7, putative [Eimeria tenella]|eukprot:XP_013228740.1 nucleoside diphosphate kinase 7, putative [Eimeria tenella]
MDTPPRLAFYASWDASGAGDTKELILVYYTGDSTVELKRSSSSSSSSSTNLKRVLVPNATIQKLYQGAQLVLLSRHLRILEPANHQTAAYLALCMQPALCIWRATDTHVYPRALQGLLDSGLTLASCRELALEASLADLLALHSPNTCMQGDLSVLSSSAIVAFTLLGRDAANKVATLAPQSLHPSADTPAAAIEDLAAELCERVTPRARAPAGAPAATLAGAPAATLAGAPVGAPGGAFAGTLAGAPAGAPVGAPAGAPEAPFGVGALGATAVPEVTCCVVKPHAIQQTGAILEEIINANFAISNMQSFRLTNLAAQEFLEIYRTVLKEYPQIVEEMTNGTVVALQLEGPDAVARLRRLAGPHDPEICRYLHPSTLRAKLGTDVPRNGLHCTDLKEDGALECSYFFELMAAGAPQAEA